MVHSVWGAAACSGDDTTCIAAVLHKLLTVD